MSKWFSVRARIPYGSAMFLKISPLILYIFIFRHVSACFGGCGLGMGLMPGFGGIGGFGGLGIGGIYPGLYGMGMGYGSGCLGGCGGFGYGGIPPPICCSPCMGCGGFIGKRSVKWHLKAKQRVKHRRNSKLNKMAKKTKKFESRLRF